MSGGGISLITRAASFAAHRHVEQRRKGVAREPYINHLAEVADLLCSATDGQDAPLVAAGFLHDTLEDTETEYEELLAIFGQDVAVLVAGVTDDKSLPKAERKRLQIVNAAKKSERARPLKIADKTSTYARLQRAHRRTGTSRVYPNISSGRNRLSSIVAASTKNLIVYLTPRSLTPARR